MDMKRFRAVLASCSEHGVTKLKMGTGDDAIEVEFGAPAQLADADLGEMKLPDGLEDPTKAIREIYARDEKRRAENAKAAVS
jgi:hypothetical protein